MFHHSLFASGCRFYYIIDVDLSSALLESLAIYYSGFGTFRRLVNIIILYIHTLYPLLTPNFPSILFLSMHLPFITNIIQG